MFLMKNKNRMTQHIPVLEAGKFQNKEQKMRELERQVEEYYLSLSNKDREEERKWDEIAAQSAHHLWKD